MFATSGDVLNMALAIGFIVLVIFISIFLMYMVFILRDITKVMGKVTDIVTKVHSAIIEPLKAMDYIIEKVKPYIEMAVERRAKSKKK